MASNLLNNFKLDYRSVVIDEIALNGLEGIGLEYLWKRVGKRISSPVTDKLKRKLWSIVVKSSAITCYQLPKSIPPLELHDRFEIVDPTTGHLIDPDHYLDGPYDYAPVPNQYGSCPSFKVRTEISKRKIEKKTYADIINEYGDKLVMVASLEARWRALVPHKPMVLISELTPVQYCMLELIGRGRENGQTSIGKTNITRIVKDSKLVFYNRAKLYKLDLIKINFITQVTNKRGSKVILLRLIRFYEPTVMCKPKHGVLNKLINYLYQQPDYTDKSASVVKKGVIDPVILKKLKKTTNIFNFRETRGVNPEDSVEGEESRKIYVSLMGVSDDSADSAEEDENEAAIVPKFHVGVNILRQAYEAFVEAGLKGITQIQLGQLLGVEFYTCRAICRIFKMRHIIKEFLEDKGRQRFARYVATAAMGQVDKEFEEEKKKLMDFLDTGTKKKQKEARKKDANSEEEDEVPKKKMKLEEAGGDKGEDKMDVDEKLDEKIEDHITEIKVFDGLAQYENHSLLNSKRTLTLRQMRFANGIIKVIREKKCISGYNVLNNLVTAEVNEAPMDTKGLKIFVQKLITDGQAKILKAKWPWPANTYSMFICAPHVQKNDPIILAKYKDICRKSNISKKKNKTQPKRLIFGTIPRYVKIRELHKVIMKLVYFNEENDDEFPHGFTSILHLIPEMSVQLALGHISDYEFDVVQPYLTNDSILSMKMKDAPSNLCMKMAQTKSLLNALRMNMRIMASMGLVQLMTENKKHLAVLSLIYANSCAKIIDTSGVWPRKDKGIEKMFRFHTFDDVENYWRTVYNISMGTTIQLENRKSPGAQYLKPPLRYMSEAMQYDDGARYGNGLGPCGFDSAFYMDTARFWKIYQRFPKKMKVVTKAPKPPKQKIARVSKKKKEQKTAKQQVLQQPEEKTINKTRKRNHDKVTWNRWEDYTLMLCKVAMTIMVANTSRVCLNIRSTVAKDILSLGDKLKSRIVCHRRFMVIEADAALAFERDRILNELRRRKDLIQKYEGSLRKLRVKNSANAVRYLKEGRLYMLELIWIIYQLVKSKNFVQKIQSAAIDYTDFHEKYNLNSPYKKSNIMYKTLPELEPDLSVIKEGIILSVMLSYRNSLNNETSNTLYSVFRNYSELHLRTASEELRKCGAIVARDRLMGTMLRLKLQEVVQNPYKLSFLYQKRWIVKLNEDFMSSLGDCLEMDCQPRNIKPGPAMNCLLFEMQTSGVLEIVSATIPGVNCISGNTIPDDQLLSVDIDTKITLKTGTLTWTNKKNINKFMEIYSDLNPVELFSNAQANVPVIHDVQEDTEENSENVIVNHLISKGEKGSSFKELQITLNVSSDTLLKQLTELEKDNKIKRVGFYENRIIATKYFKKWSLHVDTKLIMPLPWFDLEGNIRREIFLKWTGVLVSKVIESPGCTVAYLGNICEYVTIRAVQETLEFLNSCKCVKLHTIREAETTLFSDDDSVPEVEEYNRYESFENIIVFPSENIVTKYAYLKKGLCENETTEDIAEEPAM